MPVVLVSSSSGHRWSLFACPRPIASVCGSGVSAAGVLLRPRPVFAVSPRRIGRRRVRLLWLSSCLLGVRCRIAFLPVLSDKTGGAMLLRHSCGVGGVLIEFSSALVSGLALLASSYPCRRGGACDVALWLCGLMGWRWRSVLLLDGGSVLPTRRRPHCFVSFRCHVFSFLLSLSPNPLPPSFPYLRSLNNPPPPGRGMCERVIGLRLRAERRFVCFLSCRVAHSACARSLSSCLLLGSSSRVSFFPAFRVGSRSPASGPVRFALCFLVSCVSYCVLAFRPVSSVGFGWLVALCPPVPSPWR